MNIDFCKTRNKLSLRGGKTTNLFYLILFTYVLSTLPSVVSAGPIEIVDMDKFSHGGWFEEVLELPANEKIEIKNYTVGYSHTFPTNGSDFIESITITEKTIDIKGSEKLYLLKSFNGLKEIQDLKNKTILLDRSSIAINVDYNKYNELKLRVCSKGDLFSKINMSTTAPEFMLLSQGETVNIPLRINNTGLVDELVHLKAAESEYYKHKFTSESYRFSKIKLDPGEIKEINLELEIDDDCTPGEYVFNVNASGRSSSFLSIPFTVEENTNKSKEDLAIQLSKLYVSGKAGSEVTIPVRIINSGNANLEDIRLDIEPPMDSWKIDVSKKKVDFLKSKEYETVDLTVRIPYDAENGDYFVDIKGSADGIETEETKLRVNVKTQSNSAWIGMAIIVSVISCLFVVYKKYGRR